MGYTCPDTVQACLWTPERFAGAQNLSTMCSWGLKHFVRQDPHLRRCHTLRTSGGRPRARSRVELWWQADRGVAFLGPQLRFCVGPQRPGAQRGDPFLKAQHLGHRAGPVLLLTWPLLPRNVLLLACPLRLGFQPLPILARC